MWSDSLFQIPEYINEFELRHYCFGEGDSSGGGTSDEDQMPDVQFVNIKALFLNQMMWWNWRLNLLSQIIRYHNGYQ